MAHGLGAMIKGKWPVYLMVQQKHMPENHLTRGAEGKYYLIVFPTQTQRHLPQQLT